MTSPSRSLSNANNMFRSLKHTFDHDSLVNFHRHEQTFNTKELFLTTSHGFSRKSSGAVVETDNAGEIFMRDQ